MAVIRKSIDTGGDVAAYSHEEAWNLAARTIAITDDEFGTFAMGVIVGMSVADRKFNKPPADVGIDEKTAFGCMAQAADDMKKNFEKIKTECHEMEDSRGPEWVEGKRQMIAMLLKAGAEIQDELTNYLSKETESAIDRIEKLMAQDIGSKSEAEEEDTDNPEEE